MLNYALFFVKNISVIIFFWVVLWALLLKHQKDTLRSKNGENSAKKIISKSTFLGEKTIPLFDG